MNYCQDIFILLFRRVFVYLVGASLFGHLRGQGPLPQFVWSFTRSRTPSTVCLVIYAVKDPFHSLFGHLRGQGPLPQFVWSFTRSRTPSTDCLVIYAVKDPFHSLFGHLRGQGPLPQFANITFWDSAHPLHPTKVDKRPFFYLLEESLSISWVNLTPFLFSGVQGKLSQFANITFGIPHTQVTIKQFVGMLY